MGPFFGIALLALVVFVIVYVFMRVTCYLKKKYAKAENFVWQFITSLMCDSCREACESHKKLLIRAVKFSILITAVAAAGYYIR